MDNTKLSSEEMCKGFNRTFYFTATLILIITLLIVISLVNIEKVNCDCANIPEKRFLKEWFIIAIILKIIFISFFLFGKEECYFKFINNNYLYVFVMIFGLINYIMLFRTLLFLRVMRQKCECGYGNLEKFLFWYLVIIFSMVALMILLGLIVIIISGVKVFQ